MYIHHMFHLHCMIDNRDKFRPLYVNLRKYYKLGYIHQKDILKRTSHYMFQLLLLIYALLVR